MKSTWTSVAVLSILAVPLRAETFQIDPAHSGVSFRVAHMVISKVPGSFEKFAGTIVYEKGNPKAWKAEAAIDAASINTRVEDRDRHLRSADFLDVEKYPTITFKSAKVAAVKGNRAKLHGELTIRGVTRPVVLDLEIGGVAKDPRGNLRLGATAATKINRKDFGLVWNKVLEAGGLLVGEEVEITLEVEGIAKKP